LADFRIGAMGLYFAGITGVGRLRATLSWVGHAISRPFRACHPLGVADFGWAKGITTDVGA
jgi:hypothetical protein